jgi:hypothetical protein
MFWRNSAAIVNMTKPFAAMVLLRAKLARYEPYHTAPVCTYFDGVA